MRPPVTVIALMPMTGWLGLTTDQGVFLEPEYNFLGTAVYDDNETIAMTHMLVQMIERKAIPHEAKPLSIATIDAVGLKVGEGYWTIHSSAEEAIEYLKTYNWEDVNAK